MKIHQNRSDATAILFEVYPNKYEALKAEHRRTVLHILFYFSYFFYFFHVFSDLFRLYFITLIPLFALFLGCDFALGRCYAGQQYTECTRSSTMANIQHPTVV